MGHAVPPQNKVDTLQCIILVLFNSNLCYLRTFAHPCKNHIMLFMLASKLTGSLEILVNDLDFYGHVYWATP